MTLRERASLLGGCPLGFLHLLSLPGNRLPQNRVTHLRDGVKTPKGFSFAIFEAIFDGFFFAALQIVEPSHPAAPFEQFVYPFGQQADQVGGV